MAGRVLRDSKGRFKGSTKGWGKGKAKTGGRKKGTGSNLQKRGAFRERVSATRRVTGALTRHGVAVGTAAAVGNKLGGRSGALIMGSLAHAANYDNTRSQLKWSRTRYKNTRGVIS